ncbi:hypothetical protein FSB78_13105 [Sphingomonas ginsenosidivorax]|uniref:Uncharacterized protein n=1 Tax=Sphingomonas ginsenosidivorax TaxID=862135 RepID=A0A5C6UH70_9SPHN|nr:hypothetical protein [Sphingomonas ginsenosidivorax]TXC71784.1 hypothetical protein FSB78_13105 [Sphingomonas ginsenosidivorax]
MFPYILALQADTATLVDTARRMTSVAQRCVQDPNSTDITVCGLRNADRFRVPLKTAPARRDNVAEQRAALVHARTPMEDMGPFLVGGGGAGVSATVGGSGETKFAGMRTPAP